MSSPQPPSQNPQEPSSSAGKTSRSGRSSRSSDSRSHKPRRRRREKLTGAELVAWLRKHPNLITFVSVALLATLAAYLAVLLGAG